MKIYNSWCVQCVQVLKTLDLLANLSLTKRKLTQLIVTKLSLTKLSLTKLSFVKSSLTKLRLMLRLRNSVLEWGSDGIV